MTVVQEVEAEAEAEVETEPETAAAVVGAVWVATVGCSDAMVRASGPAPATPAGGTIAGSRGNRVGVVWEPGPMEVVPGRN